MGSVYGKNIRLSVFGQSHSEGIGVVIDGLPAGEEIDLEELQEFLNRRAPGQNCLTTQRKEADMPSFLGGILDGHTCGAPVAAVIYNHDQRSKDYEEIRRKPRPSHADLSAEIKYRGFQDVRGGGHFSGRLTAPICIAGGIIKQILKRKGIESCAHISSIGNIRDERFGMEIPKDLQEKAFPVIDDGKGILMKEEIETARKNGDSVGGTVECMVTGVPGGLGDPMFDGVENRISSIVFGIPAVKGIEFGNGFDASMLKGSENNDPFTVEDGRVVSITNNHGGILGGITDGMPIVFRTAFKPTPSISVEQKTVDLKNMTDTTLEIAGRHDPCIVLRAVPVVEAAAAIAIYDLLLD